MANNNTTVPACTGDPVLAAWIDQVIEFAGVSATNTSTNARTAIINTVNQTVAVRPKQIPEWVTLVGGTPFNLTDNFMVNGTATAIPAFAAWGLDFEVTFTSLEPAVYEGFIVFETWANSTGCRGADAVMNATAYVSEQELNQLTPALEGFIYFLYGLTALTCIFFGLWVYVNRKVRIVQAMQPLFLIAILLGLLLVSSATVPLSIDDGVVDSERALDAACNAIPWLFSMGFTILFATIGVKLWRVNRIVRSSQSYRRVVLTVKDVMRPLMALFICNFSLNLIKSIMSPVHYIREPIDEDEPGVTYGYCEPGSSAAAEATSTLIVLINFGAFCFAAWQGCRARNVSDEFSESKRLGFGLFLWGQLLIVGVPALAILGTDNPATSLYLQIALIFGFCMSLIVSLYIPIYMDVRKLRLAGRESERGVRVTGLESTAETIATAPVDRISSSAETRAIHQDDCVNGSMQATICSQTARIKELEARVQELEHLVALSGKNNGDLESQHSVGATSGHSLNVENQNITNNVSGQDNIR